MKKEGLLPAKSTGRLAYLVTLLLSVLLLFIGHRIATTNLAVFAGEDENQTLQARVVKVLNIESEEYSANQDTTVQNTRVTFTAELMEGDQKGDVVTAVQSVDTLVGAEINEVEPGDKILLTRSTSTGTDEWYLFEFVRTDGLMILGGVFVLLLLLFGRMKGFNTILALIITCAAVFAVFIPAILSGKNIYVYSILVCVFSITTTYLIVNGANKKSLAAGIGCIGGVLVAGLLTVIMDHALALTGYVDEESVFLSYVSPEDPINLKAIIFAAVIIGAVGAIMDVAMSISSSLWEIREQTKVASLESLFKSGMNIGKDVMGTMTNTLVLAYIGGSLSIVLLLSAYSNSLFGLLNREMIVVEILQALIGSFGLLMTLPLTSLACSLLFHKGDEDWEDDWIVRGKKSKSN